MNEPIKSGKRPVSQRSRPTPVNSDDIFQNFLGVDPKIVQIIESKGLSIRFINYKHFVESGGNHQAFWNPISKKQLKEWGYDTMDTHTFQFGSDVDGYIRRGDLILAARPKSVNDKHKTYLQQEAQRGKNIQSRHAADLKDYSRRAGLDAKVYEGYDEDTEVE